MSYAYFMQKNMKNTYRMFKRRNRPTFYLENTITGEQKSLGTADEEKAQRLLNAQNEARQNPAMNLQMGKLYMTNADPKTATRTWEEAMNELASHGKEVTKERCARELKSKVFDVIRTKPIVGTTGEEFRYILERGGAAAKNYLRCLHNLALGMGWLHWNIIPKTAWGKSTKKPKRGITIEEHGKIIAAEQNEERRHYYEMLWLIGCAQTDGSLIAAEMFDRHKRILSYQRKKTGEWCHLEIGSSLETLVKKLPQQGLLFPKMAALKDKDRSAEFCRRCRLLEIKGVSLHSYRYAWAERAYSAGYDERFAQAALGHKSRAVHYTYAKKAHVVCPPLEDFVPKIVPFTQSEEMAVSARQTA
jgi:integrase